jgi:hypothetical protein
MADEVEMKQGTTDVAKLTDQQLKNVIENHRKKFMTESSTYVNALGEHARRIGHGLDFDKSFEIIRHAAAERRFLSYKELADASGAEWNKVHYLIGGHLWSLVEYAHRKGWPMLSAVVVNKPNLATGSLDPQTIKGFLVAARALGFAITDGETFLCDQQRQVFEWAMASNAARRAALPASSGTTTSIMVVGAML